MNVPGRSLPELTKDLKGKAYLGLVDWRHQIWRSIPFSFNEPNYLSPEIIVTNPDLLSLATNIHKATSHKRFNSLVQSWDLVALLPEEELDGLWEEVQMLNDCFGKEMEVLTKTRKPKKWKEPNAAETEGTATKVPEVVVEVEGL